MFLSFLYPIMLLSSMRNHTDLASVKKLNQALVHAISQQKFELKSRPSSQIGDLPNDKSDIFSRLPNYKYLKSYQRGIIKRNYVLGIIYYYLNYINKQNSIFEIILMFLFLDRLLELYEKNMVQKRPIDNLAENIFMYQQCVICCLN